MGPILVLMWVMGIDSEHKGCGEASSLRPVTLGNAQGWGVLRLDTRVQWLNHADSLQPHGLLHARLPCPSLPPGVCLLKLKSIESVISSNRLILCGPPVPPALSLFQQQGLFQWAGSLHQVARILEPQLQHQSFQWIFTEESTPIVMDSDLLLIVSWVLKKFQSSSSSVGVPIPILPCLLPPRPFLV